jgi:hypothetical protein
MKTRTFDLAEAASYLFVLAAHLATDPTTPATTVAMLAYLALAGTKIARAVDAGSTEAHGEGAEKDAA